MVPIWLGLIVSAFFKRWRRIKLPGSFLKIWTPTLETKPNRSSVFPMNINGIYIRFRVSYYRWGGMSCWDQRLHSPSWKNVELVPSWCQQEMAQVQRTSTSASPADKQGRCSLSAHFVTEEQFYYVTHKDFKMKKFKILIWLSMTSLQLKSKTYSSFSQPKSSSGKPKWGWDRKTRPTLTFLKTRDRVLRWGWALASSPGQGQTWTAPSLVCTGFPSAGLVQIPCAGSQASLLTYSAWREEEHHIQGKDPADPKGVISAAFLSLFGDTWWLLMLNAKRGSVLCRGSTFCLLQNTRSGAFPLPGFRGICCDRNSPWFKSGSSCIIKIANDYLQQGHFFETSTSILYIVKNPILFCKEKE